MRLMFRFEYHELKHLNKKNCIAPESSFTIFLVFIPLVSFTPDYRGRYFGHFLKFKGLVKYYYIFVTAFKIKCTVIALDASHQIWHLF